MKYIFLLLLFIQLAHSREFDWTWIGNENELFLQIDLNEGLYFDSLYTIHSTEKGQSCEITCKPLEGHLSNLKNIHIAVSVENTPSAREVFYKIKANTTYITYDDTRQTHIVEYLHEDSLLNPTIDVLEEPLFYSFLDKETSGVIRFTNLFRD